MNIRVIKAIYFSTVLTSSVMVLSEKARYSGHYYNVDFAASCFS